MDSPSSTNAAVPPPAPSRALPFILSGVMLVIYLGFILLVAFDKPLLGRTIVPGLSWGILLGALVIIGTWVLTFACVQVANREGGVR